ncbi:MAG: hypothetical protein RL226_862, partial [Bacteroidota bacterium]
MQFSDAQKLILAPALTWFETQGWTVFDFQKEAWSRVLNGEDGLVNAPTGSGKTYALLVPLVCAHLTTPTKKQAIRVIWIAPIRALAKEIENAASRLFTAVDSPWRVSIRTGDTSVDERKKLKSKQPELLITTPESLHVMLASRDYPDLFSDLSCIVVDEWHELLGTKRGVQMELALSRLKTVAPSCTVWGISATIGNMDEALHVLLGANRSNAASIVKATIEKRLTVTSLMPDEVQTLPWAGHIGLRL